MSFFVIANWKMHGSLTMVKNHLLRLKDYMQTEVPPSIEVVICLPFPYLTTAYTLLKNTPRLSLGAQNCHAAVHGAFTGEVSADMLADTGCRYVLLGHSERRIYENYTEIGKKVAAASRTGLIPILCIGEENHQQATSTLHHQLTEGLSYLPHEAMPILAYEPLWAIGKDRPAEIASIETRIKTIQAFLSTYQEGKFEKHHKIVYGGSVTIKESASLCTLSALDGLLIGRASLDSEAFLGIIQVGALTHPQ